MLGATPARRGGTRPKIALSPKHLIQQLPYGAVGLQDGAAVVHIPGEVGIGEGNPAKGLGA